MVRIAKRGFFFLSLALIILVSISIAKADNVRVIPVGGIHTGDPIVTNNPASVEIFSTSHSPITKVWLVLVLNEDTFNHLSSIAADSTTFAKGDFGKATALKIPPEAPSGAYPGTNDQYNVNAIKDKLKTSGDVYFAYKAFSISTITTTAQTFTVNVDAPGVTNLKVLVLANGYYEANDKKGDGRLNESTPFSGSTLVVPEIATLALAGSAFGALGLYSIRRRKK